MAEGYEAFHARSINDAEQFWREQAGLIDWHTPFETVVDDSRAPFTRWFAGGHTNLCHNAVDRHLAQRADQVALACISSETASETRYTYAELHREVNRAAAMLQSLGVRRGDRVLIYMPMIAEAVFAMLACARIGAIHSVVFGGFASASLALRIDDAKPGLIVSADAGSRAGKVVPYKHLLDEALALAEFAPAKVLLVDRGLAAMEWNPARDTDWASLRQAHIDAEVACVWLESSEPSYILYTSGTTGRPKGVQRDTGGYAVALAASMKHIFQGRPGDAFFAAGPPQGKKHPLGGQQAEGAARGHFFAAGPPQGKKGPPQGAASRRRSVGVFFATSDIGWVVGHSYIVYGPLLAGMTTICYEGTPLRPDAGVWWRIVEQYRVTVMFSSPTGIRVLKGQDPAWLSRYDLSSLRTLFLAGEPLDEPTATWISGALDKPVIDNYWQTETGWPVLSVQHGVDPSMPVRMGSPGRPVYGYDVRLIDEHTAEEVGANQRGILAIAGPLPPGTMTTVWRDDERYVRTYWQLKNAAGVPLYSSFDWGVRDDDGNYFILGRTDDVINVAGHRLGTREIEEAIAGHPELTDSAVVGVADAVKGQVAVAFAVPLDASVLTAPGAVDRIEAEVMARVAAQLGAVARPAHVYLVKSLPKTRSGKMLRRVIQSVCEGRDPGDLSTIEDPGALEQVQQAVAL